MRMGGEDYRLFVKSAGGVYNDIDGEVDVQPNRQTNMRDQSAKGDGAYMVQKPAKTNVTITCSGKLQLPDTDGVERVFDLAKSRTAADYQLRVTPFSASEVIFEASMYASNMSAPGATDDDNATFSFQLTLAAVPVKDQLTP